MNETFWTQRCRENRWQIVSALFLSVKWVLNRILNWFKAFRCKDVFTQMVFDSQLELCDPWNTAYNRKRKQEHFWIICEVPLIEMLKRNKSKKLFK